MARTKANSATSTEKITKVEAADTTENNDVVTDTPVTDTNDSVVDTTENKDKKTDKKAKTFKEDEMVKIKAIHRAGKSVIGLDINNPIKFDENGVAETTGKEANRLLTIPGFEIA